MNIGFSQIKGSTIVDSMIGDNFIIFKLSDDNVVLMGHLQDCCECVSIEAITGNISRLYGNPILVANESSSDNRDESGSETWTFYKLATVNGWVDIRWYGYSNGYYSESVWTNIIDKSNRQEIFDCLKHMNISNKDINTIRDWLN